MGRGGGGRADQLPLCGRGVGQHKRKVCERARSGCCAAKFIVAKVGWVFDTLTYPHLIRPIRPYSAYYGHLLVVSHYGGPRCPPTSIPCLCNAYPDKTHLHVPKPPIYRIMGGLSVFSVHFMGIPYTKQPPSEFLNLYRACVQAPRIPEFRFVWY
jgi:hypothetical protein